jgi:hypothetical protein
MPYTVEEIRGMLRRFIAREDISVEFAGKIGAAIDSEFPEDERFEDLVLALASYQPGGGEFLYSYESILPLCTGALSRLDSVR